MIDDLNGMTVFAAIAEAKGFRAAGDRLGVSASASRSCGAAREACA